MHKELSQIEAVQLPDWAYGSKWPILLRATVGAGVTVWTASDAQLPDNIIIWSIEFTSMVNEQNSAVFRLALNQTVPTNAAEMDRCESVFPHTPVDTGARGYIYNFGEQVVRLENIKVPKSPNGRRFVMEIVNNDSSARLFQLIVVISSMPKNLPEWIYQLNHTSL